MPGDALPARAEQAPWLPWTPRRAARLALDHPWRLALVYWLGAFFATAPLLKLADAGWFAAIDQAVRELPERAALDRGWLDWPEPRRRTLAENLFLSIAVTPLAGRPGPAAGDLHCEWTLDALWLQGPLGGWRLPYPRRWRLDLSRETVASAWHAWRPQLLLALWVAGALALGWAGNVYGLLAGGWIRLAARGMRRPVRGRAAWRLGRATCLPLAPVTAGLIGLYASRHITLEVALLGLAGQTVLAGLCLLWAPWGLPRADNPFRPGQESEPGAADAEAASAGVGQRGGESEA